MKEQKKGALHFVCFSWWFISNINLLFQKNRIMIIYQIWSVSKISYNHKIFQIDSKNSLDLKHNPIVQVNQKSFEILLEIHDLFVPQYKTLHSSRSHIGHQNLQSKQLMRQESLNKIVSWSKPVRRWSSSADNCMDFRVFVK